jgi:hypothetical protein
MHHNQFLIMWKTQGQTNPLVTVEIGKQDGYFIRTRVLSQGALNAPPLIV